MYSEEKIQQIEQNIMNHMQAEDDQLKEIEILAESIAKRLITNGHTKQEFQGTNYIWNMNASKVNKKIAVMCTDPVKFAIANDKYRPAIYTGEWDTDFTFEENVYMVVKAGLCSKAGRIQVEELKDD